MRLAWLVFLVSAISLEPNSGDEARLPLLPAPSISAWRAAGPVMSEFEVRYQLATLLPRLNGAESETMRAPTRADEPPAGAADPSPSTAEPESRRPGGRVTIVLLDAHYVTLPHDFLPVLLDWYEALVTGLGVDLRESDARGMDAGKIAGLMRVFLQARMQREESTFAAGSPALGWCRVYLREHWGVHAAGSTHEFLLVRTNRGWFVIDPYLRYLRPLTPQARYWDFDLVVI